MPAVQNSVVIVNFNGGKSLVKMLAALDLPSAPASEVIVVDNASFDDSRKAIRADFPTVRIIKSDKNVGFATAAQAGFREAASDVVVFCHADLVAPMHTLAELADQVREGEGRRVAAAVPQLIGRDRDPIPFIGRLPRLARGMIGMFNPAAARRCYLPALEHVADHEWAFGACMAVRADVLQSVGGFDRRFFLYFADADLCQRLHDKSWRILIRSELRVVHTGRAPNDPLPDGLAQIMRKDLRQFFQKHRPRWEQGVLHVDTQIYRLLKRQSA